MYKDVNIRGLFNVKVVYPLPEGIKFMPPISNHPSIGYFGIYAYIGDYESDLLIYQYGDEPSVRKSVDDDNLYKIEDAIGSIDNEKFGKIYFWRSENYLNDIQAFGLSDKAPELYKKLIIENDEETWKEIEKYIILP